MRIRQHSLSLKCNNNLRFTITKPLGIIMKEKERRCFIRERAHFNNLNVTISIALLPINTIELQEAT